MENKLKSRSRQMFSFQKEARFKKTTKAFQNIYSLPDLKAQRSASFGIGKRFNYKKHDSNSLELTPQIKSLRLILTPARTRRETETPFLDLSDPCRGKDPSFFEFSLFIGL